MKTSTSVTIRIAVCCAIATALTLVESYLILGEGKPSSVSALEYIEAILIVVALFTCNYFCVSWIALQMIYIWEIAAEPVPEDLVQREGADISQDAEDGRRIF